MPMALRFGGRGQRRFRLTKGYKSSVNAPSRGSLFRTRVESLRGRNACQGGKMRIRKSARYLRAVNVVAVLGGAAFAVSASAIEPTATVVEFYSAALNHYFITAYPDEAAMLDAGILVPGWSRTGVTWSAWANAGDDPNAVAVCRFFGTPGKGPNSHFYTADAAECAAVKQNPGWTFEAIAFYIETPKVGACEAGTPPVYRSFYPGADVSQSNHRFV